MAGKRVKYDQVMRAVDERLTFGKNLSFASSEAYRLLRTNVMFALPDEQRCRILGVTSACVGEGKSTTALNLAYMLTEGSKRVVLIESDMRLPTISRRLGLSRTPGLSNALSGMASLTEVLQESWICDNLSVISSGDIPPNPSELLGSKGMKSLLAAVSRKFDFVIMDLPPVTEVSDALVASRLTDGMIVVVRQRYANRRALASTMQRLELAEARVLGFVLTYSDIQAKRMRYYKKDYGRACGYASARARQRKR